MIFCHSNVATRMTDSAPVRAWVTRTSDDAWPNSGSMTPGPSAVTVYGPLQRPPWQLRSRNWAGVSS